MEEADDDTSKKLGTQENDQAISDTQKTDEVILETQEKDSASLDGQKNDEILDNNENDQTMLRKRWNGKFPEYILTSILHPAIRPW